METQIFTSPFDSKMIDYCVKKLNQGNVGIFPTDTVYGIGCNGLDIQGIDNLYKIKQRNYNKPINILVSNIDMVSKCVKNINPIEQKLMDIFWPGDLTIVFNKSKIVPDLLTSNLDTVGIRMPNNKICLELIDKLGAPIATSSANMTDEAPATAIDDKLISTFDNRLSFIIDSGPVKARCPLYNS